MELDPEEKCQLVDSFAILVQIVMAVAALSSLLFKRSIEHPQRPLLIWAMDTSKQAIAASLVHVSNVLLAYILQIFPNASQNPCVWYFLNLLLDCTVGVYLLYLFLKAFHRVGDYLNITDIDMGHYGNPPRLSFVNARFYPWFKQLFFFLSAWVFVKIIVSITLIFVPIFGILATLILSPLTGYQHAEIIFVMFVFPLVMNICQAWLIDKVLKGKPVEELVPIDDLSDMETGMDADAGRAPKRLGSEGLGMLRRSPLPDSAEEHSGTVLFSDERGSVEYRRRSFEHNEDERDRDRDDVLLNDEEASPRLAVDNRTWSGYIGGFFSGHNKYQEPQ
jgi:hypothetical protein